MITDQGEGGLINAQKWAAPALRREVDSSGAKEFHKLRKKPKSWPWGGGWSVHSHRIDSVGAGRWIENYSFPGIICMFKVFKEEDKPSQWAGPRQRNS